jgi:hypothetical protein
MNFASPLQLCFRTNITAKIDRKILLGIRRVNATPTPGYGPYILTKLAIKYIILICSRCLIDFITFEAIQGN